MVRRIFLSHSSRDADWCRRLAADLRNEGFSVWFDQCELHVGDSFVEKIGWGIGQSGFVAVVLTRSSVASEWVRKELNVAIAKQIEVGRKFVIPILKEDCDVPMMLRDLLYADFRVSYSDGLRHLLAGLNVHSPNLSSSASSKGDVTSPTDDGLQIVDITIYEPVLNHPVLDFRPIRDTPIDYDGPIRLDPDAFENYPNWYPQLEVKLRNIGTRVAFVKRCEFHVSRVAVFGNPEIAPRMQVPVSYNYDVELKPDSAGKVVSVALSQAIKPNDVDRFGLAMSQSGAEPDAPVWYYFRLVLRYNETDSSCSSGPILLTVPSDLKTRGMSCTPGFENDVVARNLELLKEFSKLEGLKSPTILQLIAERRHDLGDIC